MYLYLSLCVDKITGSWRELSGTVAWRETLRIIQLDKQRNSLSFSLEPWPGSGGSNVRLESDVSTYNKGASYSILLILRYIRLDPPTATLEASPTGGRTAWDFPLDGKGPNPRCNRGSPVTADLDDGNICKWWCVFLNHYSLYLVVLIWCITLYFPICCFRCIILLFSYCMFPVLLCYII